MIYYFLHGLFALALLLPDVRPMRHRIHGCLQLIYSQEVSDHRHGFRRLAEPVVHGAELGAPEGAHGVIDERDDIERHPAPEAS